MGRGAVTFVLLDTHVLIWLMEGEPGLGPQARALADDALGADRLGVSAITFWETAMLAQRGRIGLAMPVAAWRRAVLDLGIAEIAVSGDIAIAAVSLDGLHGDPADRMICATAILRQAVLVTADERVIGWPGRLNRHDART